MKRLFGFIVVLLVTVMVIAEAEKREYAINITPGELYFLEQKLVTSGEYLFTNNVDYMWYPDRIESWYAISTVSTNSLVHIMRNVENQYQTQAIFTNEFGTIETNTVSYWTNSITTYLTNTIAVWTNSGTYSVANPDDTKNHFIRKGDRVKFIYGNSDSNGWLRFTGRR